MGIDILTTLIIPVPEHLDSTETWEQEDKVVHFLENPAYLPSTVRDTSAWIIGVVVCPFTEFFSRNGRFALIILLFIGLFRISDITMGVMADPLYVDVGFSDLDIGVVTKTVGPFITFAGALPGGSLVIRFGVLPVLFAGAILVMLTNLLFVAIAILPPNVMMLALVVGADNLSGGMAGSAFIAYLSGLTNKAYTAT